MSKRAFDVCFGASALAVASPVLAGASVAVWTTMGSPILFRQERLGRDGRVFRIYKFRTMRAADPNAEGQTDAARITRLGRFFRQTSIDELPQLLNVLRGDMSIVGPRPLVVRYRDRYSDRQRRREEVQPGLTGWAQVTGRNSLSWDEKFERDVWYVENWSPLLDLRILVSTVGRVLTGDGVSAEGHATMPEFLGTEPAER